MIENLQGLLMPMNIYELILNFIDIAIVAFLFYKLYKMLVNTRAAALVKGMIVIFLIFVLCSYMGLNVMTWLLSKSFMGFAVTLPIVFQPELRKALEQIGRGRLFHKPGYIDKSELDDMIEQVVEATTVMSRDKVGALIVFECKTRLDEYVDDRSVKIDGLVSSGLLQNIFVKDTPLHDKAVIVRGNRVYAACCELPLCKDHSLSSDLGTRHSAAVGLSEETDAYILVVSEETGIVSIANRGRLNRRLSPNDVTQMLSNGLAVNINTKDNKELTLKEKIKEGISDFIKDKDVSSQEGGKKK
ncbi:MAG: diadenylate cyclase CdaA [Phascolarctobacterium sp.]|nr:diadenylate cyclase CdaA [Phascolarctobacterium sp.]